MAVCADVSQAEVAGELVRRVESDWGRIDALINCAGPYHRVGLLEETVEGWHSMFDNNLHPIFYSEPRGGGRDERARSGDAS